MALYIVSRIIFLIFIHLNKISYNLTYKNKYLKQIVKQIRLIKNIR